MIIDSHCHLERFKNPVIPKDIFPICIGYSNESNIRTVRVAEQFNLPYVLGIAPQTVIFEGLTGLEEWISFIRSKNPKAIGEIGLDFHWAKNQEHIKSEYLVFEKMLDLAEEMKLPVVIHSRKSDKEILSVLKKRNIHKFLMHCYSGDEHLAQEFISLGGILSIPPIHSSTRKKVIENVSLECLVVESDAPYLVREIVEVKKAIEYISSVKNIDQSLVEEVTTKNAKSFFDLKIAKIGNFQSFCSSTLPRFGGRENK